jgi:hypothetical protein
MDITAKTAAVAQEILDELNAARTAGEDLRRENRGIGSRLRLLLTMTDSSPEPIRQARRMVLTAIKRTEVSDEVRRGGACHTGAERSVQLPEDTDLDMLTDGLRQLAGLTNDPA